MEQKNMSDELLNVDAAAVEAAGRDFLVSRDETEAAVNRMRNQVNNLTGTFQGSAAQAFYAKMDQLFQQLNPLIQEVGEMGQDLLNTAMKVREVQAQIRTLLQD